MPNELPLPPEIAQIDAKIQTLRLLQQGLDAANRIKSKLGETADVMGRMSKDLKGETLTFKDFINAKVNEETGELEFSLDTTKVDPLTLDKTELPANLVAEAIRAQTALEEVMNPFGEHNSKLLKSMEKLSKGLDKGSEMFAKAQTGIEQLKSAIDAFERAQDGEISGDELIEMFDKYFSAVASVFENTLGRVPGMGAMVTQYAKAINSIVPDIKKLHAITQHKNEVVQEVKRGTDYPDRQTEQESQDNPDRREPTIEDQIAALEEERMRLLDEHQRAEAERAKREIDGIVEKAKARVQARTGYKFDTVKEITTDLAVTTFLGLPIQIEQLRSKNPEDPRIGELEGQLETAAAKLEEGMGISREMDKALIEEIEAIIRQYPHVLQNADLLELQNRFPQLEQTINEIRAGNRARTSTPPPTAPAAGATATGAAAAATTETKSRVPAMIGGGLAVAMIAGASFFFFGGNDPCEDETAFGLFPGVHAVADDPCDDEDDVAVGGGGDSGDDAVQNGGGGGEAATDGGSSDSGSGGDFGVGAAPIGKELPLVSSMTTNGFLGSVATDVDQARVEGGLQGIRVWLRPSTTGGEITISGGPDGEGPSGGISPDGSGGYVWEDNAKNQYDSEINDSVKDGDVVTNIRIEGTTMSFTWERTNFDGTTWSAEISLEVPPETKRWFESLPAPSEATCSAEVGGSRNSDDSLTVNGTTDCAEGSRMTVLLFDGQRGVAEVRGGAFEINFEEADRNDSEKTPVDVAQDCHWLNGTQISG